MEWNRLVVHLFQLILTKKPIDLGSKQGNSVLNINFTIPPIMQLACDDGEDSKRGEKSIA